MQFPKYLSRSTVKPVEPTDMQDQVSPETRHLQQKLDPTSLTTHSILRYQSLLGNQGIQRLLARKALTKKQMSAAPTSIQRVQWTTGDTIQASALSGELSAGLLLAQGNPSSLSPYPLWLTTRVQQQIEEEVTANKSIYESEAKKKWDSTEGIRNAWSGKGGETAFIADFVSKKNAILRNSGSVNQRVKQRTGQQTGVNVDDQFKWNVDFQNKDGDLPGIKGAGGYKEYYAEPDSSDLVSAGFWGQNRVLHNITSGETHSGKWWVTSDHYKNYKLVV